MTNKIVNRMMLNSNKIYRPFKFWKKKKQTFEEFGFIKYTSEYEHTNIGYVKL